MKGALLRYELPVEASFAASGAVLRCRACDVSISGITLKIPQRVGRGMAVSLNFQMLIGGKPRKLSVRGQVSDVYLASDNSFHTHVTFNTLSTEVRQTLEAFVAERMHSS